MESSLRDDERFVIDALCKSCGGTWRSGENPPDAYMTFSRREIAVEISRLTQHVICESGKPIPRLSQDSGILRLCDEINEELLHVIPTGMYVILTLSAPIKKIRKFRKALIERITVVLQKGTVNNEVHEVLKNKVRIHVVLGNRSSGKKVVGIVDNVDSSSDIFANAQYILKDRISEKVKKCSKVSHRPLWLALFNDYWLAEPNLYELAMSDLSVNHPFDKICLVLENEEVLTLYET